MSRCIIVLAVFVTTTVSGSVQQFVKEHSILDATPSGNFTNPFSEKHQDIDGDGVADLSIIVLGRQSWGLHITSGADPSRTWQIIDDTDPDDYPSCLYRPPGLWASSSRHLNFLLR